MGQSGVFKPPNRSTAGQAPRPIITWFDAVIAWSQAAVHSGFLLRRRRVRASVGILQHNATRFVAAGWFSRHVGGVPAARGPVRS